MENEVRAGGLQIHKVNKWYPGNVHAVINMDMEIEPVSYTHLTLPTKA